MAEFAMSKFPNPRTQKAGHEFHLKDPLTSDQHSLHNPTVVSQAFDPKKIISNILFLGGGEIGARLLSFIGTIYLVRRLSPAAFGIIGFASVLCRYFSLPISVGFSRIGAREVAKRPEEAPSIAASAILIRLLLAFIALGCVGITVQFLHKSPTAKVVVIFTGLSFFSLALDTSWVYKGLERSRWVGFSLVLGQALYVGAILLIIRGPENVVLVPFAQFLGEVSAALLLLLLLARFGTVKLNLREGLNILRSSGPPILTGLFRTLIFNFDVLLLGLLLGEREVGLYTAPYRICFMLVTTSAAIHVSYLPALTRASVEGKSQTALLAGRSVQFASAISIPIVVGGIILAFPLLNTLFGPEYVEGAGAFRFLILSIGFIFFRGTMHKLLLIYNRLQIEMWIMAAAAGLNAGLNIFLIPRYGLVGAAFTTALSEGFIALMALLVVYNIGVKLDLCAVLRPLFAAGVMGIGLSALGPGRKLALYLGTGFFIYVLALALFRGIPQDVQPHLRKLTLFANKLRERFW